MYQIVKIFLKICIHQNKLIIEVHTRINITNIIFILIKHKCFEKIKIYVYLQKPMRGLQNVVSEYF